MIDDRVSIVYSDFPMNWDKQPDQNEVLDYCATLQEFLLTNLWEEEILIVSYSVSHLKQ
ncbi:MAG: hypothetical protein H0U60_07065 [Blastocatellia bacterium]|nr:hypothetical protein [Blastocatellia bacterium]